MRANYILALLTLLVAIDAIMTDSDIMWKLAVIETALILVYVFAPRIPYNPYIILPLLIVFHGFDRSDWTWLLFALEGARMLGEEDTRDNRDYQYIALYAGYAIVCILIYGWETQFNPARVLDGLMIFAAFYIVYGIVLKIGDSEERRKKLNREKQFLQTHDALTGLLNFQSFHHKLDRLIQSRSKLIVILIDCTDLKSANYEQGFEGVDRMLKHTAQLLRIVFSKSYCMARYGGDEFAVVLGNTRPTTMDWLLITLQTELPKLIGMPLSYGYAVYPQDGEDKDKILATAEKKLYTMKLEKRLKHEESMRKSEKLKTMGELASGMAHEIRNPLTTLKGFLQIAKKNHYNIQPWYHLMMDEISRMGLLTGEFLNFSRPRKGNMVLTDFQACVNKAVTLMESEAQRMGHEIRWAGRASPCPVLVDSDKMIQVLINIVKNAFEAMGQNGTVELTLNQRRQQVLLEIRDTGPGIDPESLGRIFHPFYTTKASGTGLGLSICQKIIQEHGGEIEVESEAGRGTTFRIMLPAAGNLSGPSPV